MEIQEIEKMILDAKSFISAVVFSGGEPTTQYDALEYLARFAKEQGLLVGIETNGYYTERLSKLIEKKLLDKIFLDIKAPLDDAKKYSYITAGKEDAALRARKSLELENVDIEVRTTVFRAFSDVLGIAKDLMGKNCTYVIQQGIPENAPEGEIRKGTAFTRDEMQALARSISFLKDVRIRTKEKGEEKII
jgi:pyruvate formate lyase activating enzyme